MFYETIDDITADAGIRVRASSLEELVCKAILATFNEITDIDRVEPISTYTVEAEGKFPFLLADIINRALILHEREKFLASRCRVKELGENYIRIELSGESFNPEKHPSKLLIKAATYHRLKIDKLKEGYLAEVIFDI